MVVSKRGGEIERAASEAVKVIAQASQDAATRLSNAAMDATKVIASAASDALKVSNVKDGNDHDLLVSLDTKMIDLRAAVEKLTVRDDLYVLKEDYIVWRNILITGLFLTITVGILMKFLVK